jgi:hypothetical protein
MESTCADWSKNGEYIAVAGYSLKVVGHPRVKIFNQLGQVGMRLNSIQGVLIQY